MMTGWSTWCCAGPAGGTQIWRQSPAGRWADATPASGVRLARPDIVDGAVFDADHDGDVDIWLVNAAGPNELLNNDGGGRFRAIGATAGVAGDGRPSAGMAVADLDRDRDADVIVLKASPPHDVFLNGRVWEYRRDAAAASPRRRLGAWSPATSTRMATWSSTRPAAGIEQWRREADAALARAHLAPLRPR